MKKYLQYTSLLTAVLIGVTACVGNKSGDKIPLPGHLIINTKEIKSEGQYKVEIKNVGETKISINDFDLKNEYTADNIVKEGTDCYGATLYPQQKCTVNLQVLPEQRGMDSLNLLTSVGLYKFPIDINTIKNGIVDTDIKFLNSTREQVINVSNKGSIPITINSLSLKNDDNTLSLKDVNCVNNQLNLDKPCQIKVKPTAGHHRWHIMLFGINNKFIKTQEVQLSVSTNANHMSVFLDDSHATKDEYTFDSPDEHTFKIKNTGTNDLHINSVLLDNAVLGSVSNNCNDTVLQSNDVCLVQFKVSKTAYGSGKLTVSTSEQISNPDYKITIDNSNLGLKDGSNEISMHTNANNEVKLVNNSKFDIKLDQVIFDSNLIKLTTDCAGVITPRQECKLNIKAYSQVKDTEIQLKEFNGGLSKTIKLHINDGITLIYQPQGSNHYLPLPQKDGNLYQIFTVVNNSQSEQRVDLKVGSNVIQPLIEGMMPAHMYLEPNCYKGAVAKVSPMSRCEIIVREPSDNDKIAEIEKPEKGVLKFNGSYSMTESFEQVYQSKVNRHNEHKDAAYPAGAKIMRSESIDFNYCGMEGGAATLVRNDPMRCTPNARGGTNCYDGSTGFVLNADLVDSNTISLTFFYAFDYSPDISGRCAALQATNFVLNDNFTYNDTTLIANTRVEQWGYFVEIIKGSYCKDNLCNIGFQMRWEGSPNFILASKYLNFTRPTPAMDWVVVDSVVWKSDWMKLFKNKKVKS